MFIIVCHPKTWDTIKQQLEMDVLPPRLGLLTKFNFSIKLTENVPEFEDAKMYEYGDKVVTTPDDIWIDQGMISYGSEDVDWLLYAGIVKIKVVKVNFIRVMLAVDTLPAKLDPTLLTGDA